MMVVALRVAQNLKRVNDCIHGLKVGIRDNSNADQNKGFLIRRGRGKDQQTRCIGTISEMIVLPAIELILIIKATLIKTLARNILFLQPE